jgi:hypothetical protein
MAYYAFLDSNNVVTEVIAGIDETELIEGLIPEEWYGNLRNQTCIRTSYNAATNGFRKHYAGIGYTYDATADAFIAPKLFPSWLLDANYDWQAPIAYPADGKHYEWDESNQAWVEFPAI